MTDLGTLGGQNSFAYGINSSGLIVGSTSTSNGSGAAFIYSNGVMTDLTTLTANLQGRTLGGAMGINDEGFILAADNNYNDYLLIPTSTPPPVNIPEPSIYAVIVGTAAMGFVVARRRKALA